MAYFPNGTSASFYQEAVCDACVHVGECAVWQAHMMKNYDQLVDGEIDQGGILQILIPEVTGADGKRKTGLCKMFYSENPLFMEKAKETWASETPIEAA